MGSEWRLDPRSQRYYRIVLGDGGDEEYEWDRPGGQRSKVPRTSSSVNQSSATPRTTTGHSQPSAASYASQHSPNSSFGYSSGAGSYSASGYNTAVTSPANYHTQSPNTNHGHQPRYASQSGNGLGSPSHNANHSSASNYPLSTTSPYTTQNPYSSVQYTSSSASRSRDDTTDRHGNYVETPTTNGSGEPDLNGLAANLDNLSLGRTNDRQAPRRRRMSSNNYGNGHGSSQHGYGAQNGLETIGERNETLDPRFKVPRNPRAFFKVGRVFVALVHDNLGVNGSVNSTAPSSIGRFGEPIYTTPRRLVVVKEEQRYCLCIPISTYGRQGVAKRGVEVDKHAVIHMKGEEPFVSREEPKMTKQPLAVEPATSDETLHPMSRLHFGKVHTIEHNIKVYAVGLITDTSKVRLIAYARNELRI